METKELQIGKINVVSTVFENSRHNNLCFEWVESSSYCMYSDQEVSVDVEHDDAVKLIALLKSHFEIE